MKLISFVNLSYLVSVTVHLTILAVSYFIVYEPRPVTPSFKTSVFFESKAPVVKPDVQRSSVSQPVLTNPLENIPLTRNHRRKPSIKKRPGSVPQVEKQKLPSLNKYITPPTGKLAPKDNRSGYLRANKRTEATQLPLLAEKPKLDTNLTPDIDDADLSGSAVGADDSGKTEHSRPFVPSPSISEEATREKRPPTVASIWQRKSELTIYRNTLARLVTANWIVPRTSAREFQIIIEAKIDRRGNLISIRLRQSSGLAVLDAAAERAIRVSTPFPGFPESFDKSKESYHAVFRFTPEKVAN